jgi:hypothetical protein
MSKQEINDEAMMELIRIIGKPTLEYMLKRIQNKIVQDKNNSDMPVNSFLSVIIGSLAIINASTLKWISASTQARLGEPIDLEKLRLALIKNINDQLGIKVN